MRFAHLADCHIGAWRDPRLRDITTDVFCKVMDRCIQEGVDFIIIAGDLFNTSLPSIDLLKVVVRKLMQVKKKGIPVYGIAGSHDFSPSGKTMLDVLQEADLFINVARIEQSGEENPLMRLKYTQDEKTGVLMTGILGKKGGLDKEYYSLIDRDHLDRTKGFRIFLFHTTIEELKPDYLSSMPGNPISLLPAGFDYYAGGHVHIVRNVDLLDHPNVVYPGPLFPNSFTELEKLDCGGFYLVDVLDGKKRVRYIPIEVHPIVNIEVDSQYMTPEQLTQELLRQTDRRFDNAVITIRVKGILREGSISDIKFKEVFDRCYCNGAHFVMKNNSKLRSSELEQMFVKQDSVEVIEQSVIDEHVGQFHEFSAEEQKKMAHSLLQVLSIEKDEGERVADFEQRLIDDLDIVLKDKTSDTVKLSSDKSTAISQKDSLT